MPSFVQPPQGITASFSAAAKRTISAICASVSGFRHRGRDKAVDLPRSKFRGSGEDMRAADDFFKTRERGLRGMAHAGVVAESGNVRLHADFSAGFAERKHFSGIQSSRGIERRAHARISARSSGVNISGMSSFFSMPTPCSPVSAPPTATQCRMISPPAATTRSNCARSRSSNRISGCRLPSPA